MNHRVAFVGASGTGKTTLMNTIAGKFDLPICPIGSRSVSAGMGFDNPYDVDAAGKRLEFQRRLFLYKHAWEESTLAFITDRTPIDSLAYAWLHGCATEIRPEEVEKFVNAMHRYTSVFYMPLGIFQKLGDDPMRIPNPMYHVAFDVLIRGLLVQWQIPFVRLTCTLEKRSAWVEKAIIDRARESYSRIRSE